MPNEESLGQRVRRAIEGFRPDDESAFTALRGCYDDQVKFEDPIQVVQGLDAFMAANRRLVHRARRLEMKVENLMEGPEQIFLRWTLTFALKMTPTTAEIRGVSHMVVRSGKIVHQVDFWDPCGAFVGSIPGVGMLYRRILALFG